MSENQRKMHRECLFVDRENATFVGMSIPIRCHLYYETFLICLVVRYPAVWSVYKVSVEWCPRQKESFFLLKASVVIQNSPEKPSKSSNVASEPIKLSARSLAEKRLTRRSVGK